MTVDEVKTCKFVFVQSDGSIIQHECEYKVSMDHRNGKRKKSQWCVSPNKEVECFETNYEEFWCDVTHDVDSIVKAFGCLKENGEAIVLGKNRFDEEVRIARFIVYPSADLLKRQWHGYPSCYWRNDQDVPNSHYLNKWADMNIISESDKKKILRGKKCRKL